MSEDTPAPAPEPPPEPHAEAEPEPQSEPQPERKPRRRGRTTLLIAVAAVLGVLAGAGTGYKIQQDRPETPLPPLAQPKLVQPAGAAAPAAPLTAAEDHLVKTDGDLRKLLLERPKGAVDPGFPVSDDRWLLLADYADRFDDPSRMFRDLSTHAFRRAAVTAWGGDHHTSFEIQLVQFRDERTTFAVELLQGQQGYMKEDKYAGNEGTAIPGDVDGRVWVFSKPVTKEGYEPRYRARGLARRGDIFMQVWIHSSDPISTATVLDVSKRQLERL
ncbi:hypothetical protein G3I60_21740 [Streptomyces sp. SID13666]|uniref:hypothetical protein n=1 Tax=unclassified Streptomyces TaxID=2593676 RepID=UPI0013BEC864|nr:MULTISPECIES: hypothetical protein [unclassified Streptomyces]NEA56687.1 hypothetical protein [Streptomyces sp. SID13666]NEA73131.1 hypothetical protein [Streptomyces sp. SID13588]